MKWYNENTDVFMKRGYLRNNQTIEDKINEISTHAENILGKKGFKDRLEENIKKGYYIIPTPTWKNFNPTAKESAISCFGVFIDDTVESILLKAAEVGIQNKIGGGSSGYFGSVRPRGSKIGEDGKSNGSVSMMEIYEKVSEIISQPNRRGHFSATQDIENLDIDEFLRIRSEGHPIQELSFSVSIGDEFMNKVLDEDEESVDKLRKVIKCRFETGFPYIFFRDTVNKKTVDVYKDLEKTIYHSNMCVKGDTLILTDKGYLPIKDLKGTYSNVWNGTQFSKSFVDKTGERQKLLRVITDSGQDLECTEYHRFFVQKGYNRGTGNKKLQIIEKRANQLLEGDKLIKFDLPVIEGFEELEYAYDNGFYSGDGCKISETNQRIYLYGGKKSLKKHFTSTHSWFESKSSDRIEITSKKLKDKFFVPNSDFTIESRLTWLAGYLDADGCVTNNEGSEAIQAVCVNLEFLKDVQLMLQTLGINAKIKHRRSAGHYMLPKNDGSGESKLYPCKETYILLISTTGLYQLNTLGFKTNRLVWEGKKPKREASHFVKIDKVVDVDGFHDTYCFKEPLEGKGMFNGILTGNCHEIALPNTVEETFVCNLLGMNIEKFDEWKDTDAVEVGIYFMDAMLTDFINKNKDNQLMQPAVRFAENHRAMGMGASGYHDYLQSKGVPFSSMEAKFLNTTIFKTIKEQAYKASEKMALEYGKPSLLKSDKYKRRHTTLLAVAPNTSSAFIMGQQSQSIEPHVSNYYVKDVAKTRITVKNKNLEKLLNKIGKNTEDVWDSIMQSNGSVQHLDFLTDNDKKVFETFGEISQMEILLQASSRQNFIDQSQSLNLMIPSNATPSDVAYLIIRAWQLGVKTLYYQLNISAVQEFGRSITECESCAG